MRSPRRVVLADRARRDLRRIQSQQQREAIAGALDRLQGSDWPAAVEIPLETPRLDAENRGQEARAP